MIAEADEGDLTAGEANGPDAEPATTRGSGHAVISGGSSGIGLALARLLADAGWDLTLLAREPTRLDSARTELVARGARVLAQSTDVADMPAVERAMQAAIFAHGVPRLVIAGAGMVVPRPFEVQPLDAFRRTMEVNYFGTLHLARAAVPGPPAFFLPSRSDGLRMPAVLRVITASGDSS